jgi:putative NIF3 family GTP cyclohydrolase 1 type 2
MKLGHIHREAVRVGLELDPRGREAVQSELERTRRRHADLPAREKEFFDPEKLENPYADTRIVWGDPDTEVGGLMVGIDVEVGEILLADRLRAGGRRIDAILCHHPEGKALAQFHEVMTMQADILAGRGVPINVAEALLAERIREVSRRIMPLNHARTGDAARELSLPLLCVHTPADNTVTDHLQRLLDQRNPARLGEVLEILREIPEYHQAARESAGPTITVGAEEGRCGRIMVDMTGGTEGSREVFAKLSVTQTGTLVCMHLSEDHLKEAEKHHINVVVAGHIASDNLGLNLLLDRLTGSEPLEITAVSGFRRVERPPRG